MKSQEVNPPSLKLRRARKMIAKLPDTPGVYQFVRRRGGSDKILYIGKATSLKDRVRSYFNTDIVNTRSPLISRMLSDFDEITFQKTDSVLEALVLEANLIKKYQPVANIKDKDNRSFNYVVITEEDFPRVLIMRARELEKFFSPHSSKSTDIFLLENSSCSPQSGSQGFSRNDGSKNFSISKTFGPFPNGSQLKEAMKIVRRMFPFRDKCVPPSPDQGEGRAKRGVRCFNYQIGLCPGVCTGEISKKDYKKQIKNIILFFEGNKKKLIKNLEKEMKNFAKERKFEMADKIKRQIFALNHIQDVALIKDNEVSKGIFDTRFRIESYDVAHLSGTNMVGVMTVVEDGEVKKSDYRKFKIKNNSGLSARAGVNDTKALSEVLSRRLAHIEWPEANLIVVDGGVSQKKVMEKVLKGNRINIPVVSVVKDERHKPKDILGDKKWFTYKKEILISNAEAHRFAIGFHKQLRRKLI
jgi:excinuclease ABC subunit C